MTDESKKGPMKEQVRSVNLTDEELCDAVRIWVEHRYGGPAVGSWEAIARFDDGTKIVWSWKLTEPVLSGTGNKK